MKLNSLRYTISQKSNILSLYNNNSAYTSFSLLCRAHGTHLVFLSRAINSLWSTIYSQRYNVTPSNVYPFSVRNFDFMKKKLQFTVRWVKELPMLIEVENFITTRRCGVSLQWNMFGQKIIAISMTKCVSYIYWAVGYPSAMRRC